MSEVGFVLRVAGGEAGVADLAFQLAIGLENPALVSFLENVALGAAGAAWFFLCHI